MTHSSRVVDRQIKKQRPTGALSWSHQFSFLVVGSAKFAAVYAARRFFHPANPTNPIPTSSIVPGSGVVDVVDWIN